MVTPLVVFIAARAVTAGANARFPTRAADDIV